MIGGLLFRYWEGGARAVTPEHPNVRIEWLRRSRKNQQELGLPEPQPALPDTEAAELVPLRAILAPAAARAAAVTPWARARRVERALTQAAAVPRTTRPGVVALRTPVVASTATTHALAADHQPMAVAQPDEFSARRHAVNEHNRRAIAAALAVYLASGE